MMLVGAWGGGDIGGRCGVGVALWMAWLVSYTGRKLYVSEHL